MASRVLAAALLFLVLPGVARAQAPSLRWSYSRGRGAERCPDEPTMRRAITAQLGRDPFVGEGDDAVALDVRRTRNQLRARIELRERDGAVLGARELRGDDCDELVPAMTLAIAMAIDALAARTPPPPPPPPQDLALAKEPADAAVLQATDDEVPVLERPVKVQPRWLVSLGLLAAIDATMLAAAGVTLQADWVRPRYSVGLELRGDLPASNDQLVTASLWTASFVPCLRHRFASLCGLASLGAELAGVSSVPLNLVGPRSISDFWLGLGARVAVELPLYKLLGLRLHADVIAPLLHHKLTLTAASGDVVYYATPSVSSAFGLALLASFP
jgi:hypothetical protein